MPLNILGQDHPVTGLQDSRLQSSGAFAEFQSRMTLTPFYAETFLVIPLHHLLPTVRIVERKTFQSHNLFKGFTAFESCP